MISLDTGRTHRRLTPASFAEAMTRFGPGCRVAIRVCCSTADEGWTIPISMVSPNLITITTRPVAARQWSDSSMMFLNRLPGPILRTLVQAGAFQRSLTRLCIRKCTGWTAKVDVPFLQVLLVCGEEVPQFETACPLSLLVVDGAHRNLSVPSNMLSQDSVVQIRGYHHDTTSIVFKPPVQVAHVCRDPRALGLSVTGLRGETACTPLPGSALNLIMVSPYLGPLFEGRCPDAAAVSPSRILSAMRVDHSQLPFTGKLSLSPSARQVLREFYAVACACQVRYWPTPASSLAGSLLHALIRIDGGARLPMPAMARRRPEPVRS